MSDQTVPPEDRDFVDESTGQILRFVSCALCDKQLMGENTRGHIKRQGDVSLLAKFDQVAARVGDRPFCTACLPNAAAPIPKRKPGRPRKPMKGV